MIGFHHILLGELGERDRLWIPGLVEQRYEYLSRGLWCLPSLHFRAGAELRSRFQDQGIMCVQLAPDYLLIERARVAQAEAIAKPFAETETLHRITCVALKELKRCGYQPGDGTAQE